MKMMQTAIGLSFIFILLQGFTLTEADSVCSGAELNSTECLTALRDVLSNTTMFWFGSDCTSSCYNADLNRFSIMTRARQSDDNTTSSIMQVLNVTFDTPPGSYQSCGKQYDVPAYTGTLDPTITSDIPLWSADHMPRILWEAENDTYYFMIVWDAGAFKLHGVMFNLVDGDSNSGHIQFARNYRGPKNPANRPQPYVFFLYKQSAMIANYTSVTSFVTTQLSTASSTNMNNVDPSPIVAQFGLGEPIGANILTVKTDPYATQYMKENNIVNNCPATITPIFQSLPLSYNVSSIFLQSSVDVTFNSRPIEVSSCCSKRSFMPSMRMTDPLSNGPLPALVTRSAPRVTFDYMLPISRFHFFMDQYTLLLLDITDELAMRENPNTIVHWQAVNIREGDLRSGETVLSYKAPMPSTAAGRTLMFMLFKQNMMQVNTTDLLANQAPDDCPAEIRQRCRFNLTRFIMEHSMTIEGVTWFQSVPDAYSRQELLKVSGSNANTICQGVPGYASPCPSSSTCTNGVNRLFNLNTNNIVLLFITLVCSYCLVQQKFK